jgi:glycine dehydrogenase subunit 2
MSEPLIFEMSKKGKRGYSLPSLDVPRIENLIPEKILPKSKLNLPELSEPEVVRHFTRLSQLNMGIDSHFYPLGSCTMKYNPKVNEEIANLPGWAKIHPYQPEETVQGALSLLYEMEKYLAEISGMDRISFQPAAGAQGELVALLMIKASHQDKGRNPKKVLLPDSAHGTNPASAYLSGYEIKEVKSDKRGNVDLSDLKKNLTRDVSVFMLTNPNTLGLFEENILEIAEMVHKCGALFYYDGANMNAILGITRPGDFGVDIMHFNLHKTFSTPHGGGGPGSGPLGVKKELAPYLPLPSVERSKKGNCYLDYNRPQSIGRVKAFYGNFSVVVKAYAYTRALGAKGLLEVSKNAVLNANYLMQKLRKYYLLPYKRNCKHEFVLSAERQKEKNVSALDIAKRLLDYGFHPPTIYFPLIVKEALMIEPTETETKETLDNFIWAMIQIAQEIEREPDLVKNAPHSLKVSRLNEVKAAREPKLRWRS